MEGKRTWQPLLEEPDPVELAVIDVVRDCLTPTFGRPDGERRFERCVGRLPDGEEILVDFTAVLASASPRWNGRDTVSWRLSGHAARRERAVRFDGIAVVDVATRAYVSLEVVFGETHEPRR